MAGSDSKVQSHWLNRYSISVKSVAGIACLWVVLGLGLYHSPAGDYLDAKIATPINFRMRDLMGFAPKHDPRLKILVYDDRAFAHLGTPGLSLELWGDLLDGIAESKPRAIFIDAMLSTRPTDTPKKIAYYFSRWRELGVPVTLGAFVSPQEVPFKAPLQMNQSWYELSHFLEKPDISKSIDEVGSSIFNRNRSRWHAYGPAKELQDLFQRNGHLQLFEDNKIEPFLYLGDGRVLPHLSMFAPTDVKIGRGNLLIDGHRVALDRRGAIDVNFVPPSKWRTKSLLEVIDDVKQGYKPSGISQGDVVLILPLFFTGNTDFRPSPYGLIPGGLFLASMLNSVLSGQWLQEILATEILVIAGVAVLGAALMNLGIYGFWTLLAVFVGVAFVSAEILFAHFGFVVPWLIPVTAWTLFSVHVFILKMRFNERKVVMLKAALDGAVDPAQLQRVLRRPEDINLDARERVVTLMFIDVVGFSLSAENMLPRLAFDILKEILLEMGNVVHEFGGVIDKTLGDGLLCYFGYRFDSDETTTDHAEMALRCAMRIQELNMERNLKALSKGEPLYPLRIGINTASSYLGDLGSGQRIEFTVVGNGVNFAKRLEGACNMLSVMIGMTTWELVKSLDLNKASLSRKLIRIKHHKELIDAYEYDPLYDRKEIRQKFAEAFRRTANLQRLNERIPINDSASLSVVSSDGTGTVVNFSGTGISLRFKTLIPKGKLVRFTLDSRESGLKMALAELGIEEIEAEVRWNYQAAGGFIHGMMFKNIPDERREDFVFTLSEYAFNDIESPEIGGTSEAV